MMVWREGKERWDEMGMWRRWREKAEIRVRPEPHSHVWSIVCKLLWYIAGKVTPATLEYPIFERAGELRSYLELADAVKDSICEVLFTLGNHNFRCDTIVCFQYFRMHAFAAFRWCSSRERLYRFKDDHLTYLYTIAVSYFCCIKYRDFSIS